MDRLLLLTGSDRSAELLRSLIDASAEYDVTVEKSADKALELLKTGGFDAVIVNAAPTGESCAAAFSAAALGKCPVILLVGEETADILAQECARAGVFTVTKPISLRAFSRGLRLAREARGRLDELRSGGGGQKNSADETKLIDRAKCVLIQYLGMSEAMAHRYIEKQAMDTGSRRVKIAENILRTYEP